MCSVESIARGIKPMKSNRLRLVKSTVMRPVAPAGRKANDAYRVREHLTEGEMDKLLKALKANRHGHRDWLIGLLIYRHGLRVSEACDLRWDDIDLPKRTIVVGSRRAFLARCMSLQPHSIRICPQRLA